MFHAVTTKACRRCSTKFLPERPNQQYCSRECSSAGRSDREKIYQQNRISRVSKEKTQHPITIQKACDQTEEGRVTIIDIAKDLPETLSKWDLFAGAYYSQVGTVIKFVKIDEHHWSILKETEREVWTVGKWIQWFESTRKKEEKIEAYYLIDIPVHAVHVQKLRQNPLIDAFSYEGKLCLTQYIRKLSEDIPTPDLKYKALIAPPWGRIMTFPHKNGIGTLLSVHCCIIGSGYNLVHYWPRLNSCQDMLFRKMTNLPPNGAKQKDPYDFDATIDDSNTVWDAELEKKLTEDGNSSYSIRLAPGQAIILPPDQFHCFKKIFQDDNGTPLVGLACNSTYVGSTERSFERHYQSIFGIQRVHRWPNRLFCTLELTLYCLFQSLVSLPSMMSDVIFSTHVKSAFPRFVSWVQLQTRDAKKVMDFIGCTEDDIITIISSREELLCRECKFSIVNIFVTAKGSDTESTCTSCLFKKISAQLEPCMEYRLKCRFASPKALEHLLTNVKKLLGEGTNQSKEEIAHNVVSGTLSQDQGSVDQLFEVSTDNENDTDIQQLDDIDEQIPKETPNESVSAKSSDSNSLDETSKPISLFGMVISSKKRKPAREESDAVPTKKKLKLGTANSFIRDKK